MNDLQALRNRWQEAERLYNEAHARERLARENLNLAESNLGWALAEQEFGIKKGKRVIYKQSRGWGSHKQMATYGMLAQRISVWDQRLTIIGPSITADGRIGRTTGRIELWLNPELQSKISGGITIVEVVDWSGNE